MLGALLIHNVVPSPVFISEQPVLAYGIFTAFFVAHFMMIGMQTFALNAFLYITRVPMYTMAAVILVYCAIGTFALNNSPFDMWTLFWFGLLGYLMKKFGFPLAPVILGVVLGDLAELNLNRAWTISEDGLAVRYPAVVAVLPVACGLLHIIPVVSEVPRQTDLDAGVHAVDADVSVGSVVHDEHADPYGNRDCHDWARCLATVAVASHRLGCGCRGYGGAQANDRSRLTQQAEI